MRLKGKTALVTGGSGDIGKAIAEALAASGADVAISYVGEAGRAGELVERVRGLVSMLPLTEYVRVLGESCRRRHLRLCFERCARPR